MMTISETVQDNGVLRWPYTRPNQQCYFEWTLSDLAKYSMTRSVARSLYDS